MRLGEIVEVVDVEDVHADTDEVPYEPPADDRTADREVEPDREVASA